MSEEVVVPGVARTAIGDYGKSLASVPLRRWAHWSPVKRCLALPSTPRP
jgi:hypothetical protein